MKLVIKIILSLLFILFCTGILTIMSLHRREFKCTVNYTVTNRLGTFNNTKTVGVYSKVIPKYGIDDFNGISRLYISTDRSSCYKEYVIVSLGKITVNNFLVEIEDR